MDLDQIQVKLVLVAFLSVPSHFTCHFTSVMTSRMTSYMAA